MMLEVLVIACLDMSLVATDDAEAGPNAVSKPVNGLVVGVLVAYIVDYILIGIRMYKGRKNFDFFIFSFAFLFSSLVTHLSRLKQGICNFQS